MIVYSQKPVTHRPKPELLSETGVSQNEMIRTEPGDQLQAKQTVQIGLIRILLVLFPFLRGEDQCNSPEDA